MRGGRTIINRKTRSIIQSQPTSKTIVEESYAGKPKSEGSEDEEVYFQ